MSIHNRILFHENRADSCSGILGRLEPNKDAKMCRLTIRSTNEHVSAEFLALLSRPLNAEAASS